jgi:hypothetical protein
MFGDQGADQGHKDSHGRDAERYLRRQADALDGA